MRQHRQAIADVPLALPAPAMVEEILRPLDHADVPLGGGGGNAANGENGGGGGGGSRSGGEKRKRVAVVASDSDSE